MDNTTTKNNLDWGVISALSPEPIGAPRLDDDQIAQEDSYSSDRFTIFTVEDAFNTDMEIEWIINGLFSAGSVNLIVGEAGSKKTFCMVDAAVCVAKGDPWLGHKTTPSPVLIVDEESGTRRIADRISRAVRGHQGDASLPLYYTALGCLNLTDPNDCQELEKLVEKNQARFILIDALADVMPGADENSVKDVQPVFQALRGIADRQQCAIAVIHHCNKSGTYRGSTAMSAAVDLMVMVESKQGSTNIDISSEKARDVESFAISAVVNFKADEVWLAPSTVAASVRPLSPAQLYVLHYLLANGNSTVTAITDHPDTCSSESARKAVYSLADLGYIQRVDAGGSGSHATYGLTESGRALSAA